MISDGSERERARRRVDLLGDFRPIYMVLYTAVPCANYVSEKQKFIKNKIIDTFCFYAHTLKSVSPYPKGILDLPPILIGWYFIYLPYALKVFVEKLSVRPFGQFVEGGIVILPAIGSTRFYFTIYKSPEASQTVAATLHPGSILQYRQRCVAQVGTSDHIFPTISFKKKITKYREFKILKVNI